jgi:hypothetical protein
VAALLSVIQAVTACSSSDGPETPTAQDAGADSASTGTALVGGFTVSLVEPVALSGTLPATPGYTAILGKFYDAPLPEAIVWETASSAEGCRLLTPRIPFCDPSCTSAVCVEDNTCQPNPSPRTVGTVTVAGIRTESGDTTFTMDPVANSYQPAADVKLPSPAFSEGASLGFSASGGTPFALEAPGIAPLELAQADHLLTSGEPLALGWAPPASPGSSRIHVILDISHHGGTNGKVECDVDDDGAFTLPVALTAELLSLGYAGYPSIVVARSSTGSAPATVGRVTLRVSSTVERFIQISGLTSCNEDTDCPVDQTCQSDLSCR